MSIKEILQRFQLPEVDALFPTLHTPYFKYCNTNHIASDSEFGEVRKIASELQAQLNDLDIILERIGKILSQLNEKRTRIVSSLRLHQGLTSSIRRLPSEILKEIFVQCLPPPVTDPDEGPLEPDTSKAPLLLTGVCRRWREIALDTPRLWCSLVIIPGRWSRKPQQKDLIGYLNWLSRSRNFPLSISLVLMAYIPLEWTNSLFEILRPHSSRFRRLNCGFNDPVSLNGLLKDVPILEDLDLCCRSAPPGPKITIVQAQPRLHALSLDGLNYGVDTLSIAGWSNLTYLKLSSHHGGCYFWEVLELCPNLDHLYFSSELKAPTEVISFPRALTHTSLHSLYIRLFWNSSIDILLTNVTLPQLRHLTLEHIRTTRYEDFKTFLSRSRCPLETLDMDGECDWDGDGHEDLPTSIPTLQRLQFRLEGLRDLISYSWSRANGVLDHASLGSLWSDPSAVDE